MRITCLVTGLVAATVLVSAPAASASICVEPWSDPICVLESIKLPGGGGR